MDLNVIICTYNRSASLARTLDSINRSSIPEGLVWELIVVDNNSSDDTEAVVARYRDREGLPIRYLKEEEQGISHARNRGISASRGKVIAFTDDDVVVDPCWIANIVRAFEDDEVQCVGGRILPIWEKPKPEWLSERLHVNLALLDYGDVPFYVQKPTLWGANLAVRTEAFQRHGVFDTSRGRIPQKLYGDEESHFLRKLLEREEKILYLPHAVVHHCIPASRMRKMYFRKWSFDQGELHGILCEEQVFSSALGLIWFVFRGICASARSFLKSFLPQYDTLTYQRGAAYRLGYTRGKIRSRLRG